MMTAREQFEAGTHWVDITARPALPVLLSLAIRATPDKFTYRELDLAVAQRLNRDPMRVVVSYGKVLGKVGEMLNQLSTEWQEEIPPLTILITNKNSGLPSLGVDGFLQRYVAKSTQQQLTSNNRTAMSERATDDVYNYQRWNDVAAYFGVDAFGEINESAPIPLPAPPQIFGGESNGHLELKKYVASHPELFASLGRFNPGQIEAKLYSGDEVDVLFRNEDQTLAVEVKTADASPGELTRGIFQCVKYRAVLRAMHQIASELCTVQVVLVTPQHLFGLHVDAARRLGVNWQQVKV